MNVMHTNRNGFRHFGNPPCHAGGGLIPEQNFPIAPGNAYRMAPGHGRTPNRLSAFDLDMDHTGVYQPDTNIPGNTRLKNMEYARQQNHFYSASNHKNIGYGNIMASNCARPTLPVVDQAPRKTQGMQHRLHFNGNNNTHGGYTRSVRPSYYSNNSRTGFITGKIKAIVKPGQPLPYEIEAPYEKRTLLHLSGDFLTANRPSRAPQRVIQVVRVRSAPTPAWANRGAVPGSLVEEMNTLSQRTHVRVAPGNFKAPRMQTASTVTWQQPKPNIEFSPPRNTGAGIGSEFWDILNSPRVPHKFTDEDENDTPEFWVCDPEIWRREQESRNCLAPKEHPKIPAGAATDINASSSNSHNVAVRSESVIQTPGTFQQNLDQLNRPPTDPICQFTPDELSQGIIPKQNVRNVVHSPLPPHNPTYNATTSCQTFETSDNIEKDKIVPEVETSHPIHKTSFEMVGNEICETVLPNALENPEEEMQSEATEDEGMPVITSLYSLRTTAGAETDETNAKRKEEKGDISATYPYGSEQSSDFIQNSVKGETTEAADRVNDNVASSPVNEIGKEVDFSSSHNETDAVKSRKMHLHQTGQRAFRNFSWNEKTSTRWLPTCCDGTEVRSNSPRPQSAIPRNSTPLLQLKERARHASTEPLHSVRNVPPLTSAYQGKNLTMCADAPKPLDTPAERPSMGQNKDINSLKNWLNSRRSSSPASYTSCRDFSPISNDSSDNEVVNSGLTKRDGRAPVIAWANTTVGTLQRTCSSPGKFTTGSDTTTDKFCGLPLQRELMLSALRAFKGHSLNMTADVNKSKENTSETFLAITNEKGNHFTNQTMKMDTEGNSSCQFKTDIASLETNSTNHRIKTNDGEFFCPAGAKVSGDEVQLQTVDLTLSKTPEVCYRDVPVKKEVYPRDESSISLNTEPRLQSPTSAERRTAGEARCNGLDSIASDQPIDYSTKPRNRSWDVDVGRKLQRSEDCDKVLDLSVHASRHSLSDSEAQKKFKNKPHFEENGTKIKVENNTWDHDSCFRINFTSEGEKISSLGRLCRLALEPRPEIKEEIPDEQTEFCAEGFYSYARDAVEDKIHPSYDKSRNKAITNGETNEERGHNADACELGKTDDYSDISDAENDEAADGCPPTSINFALRKVSCESRASESSMISILSVQDARNKLDPNEDDIPHSAGRSKARLFESQADTISAENQENAYSSSKDQGCIPHASARDETKIQGFENNQQSENNGGETSEIRCSDNRSYSRRSGSNTPTERNLFDDVMKGYATSFPSVETDHTHEPSNKKFCFESERVVHVEHPDFEHSSSKNRSLEKEKIGDANVDKLVESSGNNVRPSNLVKPNARSRRHTVEKSHVKPGYNVHADLTEFFEHNKFKRRRLVKKADESSSCKARKTLHRKTTYRLLTDSSESSEEEAVIRPEGSENQATSPSSLMHFRANLNSNNSNNCVNTLKSEIQEVKVKVLECETLNDKYLSVENCNFEGLEPDQEKTAMCSKSPKRAYRTMYKRLTGSWKVKDLPVVRSITHHPLVEKKRGKLSHTDKEHSFQSAMQSLFALGLVSEVENSKHCSEEPKVGKSREVVVKQEPFEDRLQAVSYYEEEKNKLRSDLTEFEFHQSSASCQENVTMSNSVGLLPVTYCGKIMTKTKAVRWYTRGTLKLKRCVVKVKKINIKKNTVKIHRCR